MGKEDAACSTRSSERIEGCCHLCDEFCKHGGVEGSGVDLTCVKEKENGARPGPLALLFAS